MEASRSSIAVRKPSSPAPGGLGSLGEWCEGRVVYLEGHSGEKGVLRAGVFGWHLVNRLAMVYSLTRPPTIP